MARVTRGPMLIRLGLLAALALVVVVVAVLLAGGDSSDGDKGNGTPAATTSPLGGIPQSGIALGSPDAPVTMVEFADLQCPFCKEYSDNVFPELLKRYVRTGKLRLELRVLRFLGPDSDRLARVAAAAAAQNRMWQFVELAYDRQGAENSGYATDGFINKLATDAGMDQADAGTAAEAFIREGERAARKANIQSTPSFLIGPTGGPFEHFQPSELTPDPFVTRIEEELGK
jgi:protein-disulfide isomerase